MLRFTVWGIVGSSVCLPAFGPNRHGTPNGWAATWVAASPGGCGAVQVRAPCLHHCATRVQQIRPCVSGGEAEARRDSAGQCDGADGLRPVEGGELRQRRADGAVLRRTGAPDGHRHGAERRVDLGQRLRLAQRRLAREPYRGGGGEPVQARGGVRLRLPEPSDRGGDVYLGLLDREPDAGVRRRPARQPEDQDQRRVGG